MVNIVDDLKEMVSSEVISTAASSFAESKSNIDKAVNVLIPTMLGGLPGMEALASSMMKKEMEKIDMPDVHEFLDILTASGVRLWACKLAMDMFHYK